MNSASSKANLSDTRATLHDNFSKPFLNSQESLLTRNINEGGHVRLPKLVLDSASIFANVLKISSLNNEDVAINKELFVSNNCDCILHPSNKWCWYPTDWTPDGDVSVGRGCHVVANVHGYWTSITHKNLLWSFRDLNNRFDRFCRQIKDMFTLSL